LSGLSLASFHLAADQQAQLGFFLLSSIKQIEVLLQLLELKNYEDYELELFMGEF